MRLNIIFIVLFIISFRQSYSQNSWNEGYVIRSSKDTLFGLIKTMESKGYSKSCYFRKDEKSEPKMFSPNEIIGFKPYNGKYYISKNIPSGDTIQNVFLEFLISGKINAYHYMGADSQFYLEKDGKIHELKNTEEVREQKGIDYLFKKKEYLGLMNLLMKDANITPTIYKTNLTSKSLINVAKEYHEKVCPDEKCLIYEKEIKPIQARVGFHVGQSINRFYFDGELMSEFKYSTVLGCRLEVKNLLIYRENYSLVLDANIQKFYKYDFKLDNDFYVGKHEAIANINSIVLNLPLVMKYTFNTSKLKPYFSAGLSNSFLFQREVNFMFTDGRFKCRKYLPRYLFGIIGRIGAEYTLANKHALYVESEVDFTKNRYQTEVTNMINLLFSFKIGYKF